MIKRQQAKAGQESVWDYPRPPRLEATNKHLQVYFAAELIADTKRAFRVLETSHSPVYYFPPDDVNQSILRPSRGSSFCEFKGQASYFGLKLADRFTDRAAWFYQRPLSGFELMANYIAFYPSLMDQCLVDGELAQAQAGGFYGGWITKDVVGPFKGEPGTMFW
jgi:uncharacterized protein (DUF427 family)